MPIRGGKPMKFNPKGLSDAFDSTDTFYGACQSLQNWIFDQGNPEYCVPRPGTPALTSFGGFSTPGVVSLAVGVGTKVYGMIASALNPGNDQPFSYDVLSNSFDPISGITALNTPTTQLTTGAWTPPTLAVIGSKVYVTHPGFAQKVGILDITNPAAPVWSSSAPTGAIASFATTPSWVQNFNNRAYYGLSGLPTVLYSDVLNGINFTNANQVLTVGDTSTTRGGAGMPITTTQSGVVQALLVFKDNQIWQITGDAAVTTNPLSMNFLSLTIGCSAPRTIVPTPLGTIFMAFDSVYFVDAFTNVRPLSQTKGLDKEVRESDIQVPFTNCTRPSRACAFYDASIYRICLDTIVNGVVLTAADYWYDFHRGRWNGPHTFGYHAVTSSTNPTGPGSIFVLASNAVPGKLFSSNVSSSTANFLDNGVGYTCVMISGQLPKKGDMFEKQVVESTIELGAPLPGSSYTVQALDEGNVIIGTVTMNETQAGPAWGSVNWGAFSWASSSNAPNTSPIPWSAPLVFQKLAYQVSVPAAPGISIGTIASRYVAAGYTVQRQT